MSKELEADKVYEILESDDVLLFGTGNTFTIGKVKELITNKCNERLYLSVATKELGNISAITAVGNLNINQEISITIKEINWNSYTEGINCQVLRVGSKGWQKGTLQIEANRVLQSGEMKIFMKFCPDRPPEIPPHLELESPLDKIRQSAEYKNL